MRSSIFTATVSAVAVLALMPCVADAQPTPDQPKADAAIDPNSDIVVTARQRAENLEKVPLAVSVVVPTAVALGVRAAVGHGALGARV